MNNKTVFIIIIFIVSGVALLLSPLFNIAEINITGNTRFNVDEVMTIAGITDEQNIILIRPREIRRNLLTNAYMQDASITKNILSRSLYIDLDERSVAGYVQHNNNFLFIDRDGRILEIRESFTERLPVITGLSIVSGFALGEYLPVYNDIAFDIMLELTGLFNKYDISKDIARIVLTDTRDIHIFYDNINVMLGNNQNLDLKIRTLREILPNIQDYRLIGGRLHLDNMSVDPYFEPNT